MLFRELIAVHWRKHVGTVCGQTAEIFMVKFSNKSLGRYRCNGRLLNKEPERIWKKRFFA
jgi:hypothetical protein